MVFAEVAKREAVEVMFVGGVSERAVVGVMGGLDPDTASWAHQPMEFLHGADHVGNVLDDVDSLQGVKRGIAKRVGKTVEVAEDIGAGGRVAVYADRPGKFVDAATDVEYPHKL